jgi:hypothetical protein
VHWVYIWGNGHWVQWCNGYAGATVVVHKEAVERDISPQNFLGCIVSLVE